MRFNVLGAMDVNHNGKTCTPTAPKVRWTLAMLLMRANRIVATSALIDELWGENPPRSAVTTTQTYIYQLRKSFAAHQSGPEPEVEIVTQPPGYGLRLQEDQLDAAAYLRLAERGRRLMLEGQSDDAARTLREALALWRGPALADVATGCHLESYVAQLTESRIHTLELRIQADMRLGRGRELVPELRSLVADYPLNEWLHGQLINALHEAGRRGDALQAYQDLRRTLDEELGLEPSAEMQRMQHDLLAGRQTRTPQIQGLDQDRTLVRA